MSEQVQVFDGVNSVLVPKCCDGKVKQVEIFEAQAHRNLVEAPHRVKTWLACMTCGKELPTSPIPERQLPHYLRKNKR